MLTFGAPACNTTDIKPIFAPTGWKTVALDHITFRVADYRKEAAFYVALMGWTLRSDDGSRRCWIWATGASAIFKQAPASAFDAPAAAAAARAAARSASLVDSFAFVIDRVGREERRGRAAQARLESGRRQRRQGLREFPRQGSRRLRRADLQRQRPVEAAQDAARRAKLAEPLPFEPTGWKTVWLDHFSFNATNYKKSASFYTNLLGWTPTYDEGSQNELLMGDVGDIIVRGGNPLDPGLRQGRRRAAPRGDRSHLVRHRAVGHRRRESGAREARPARADRHVEPPPRPRRDLGAGRDSHRGVQELSHGDAERLQPANQLRDARQPAGAAERRKAISRPGRPIC